MNKILLTLASFILTISTYATTWDEPWQKEIILESDHLAFARVTSASDSLVKIEIIKSFDDNPLSGIITLDGFFLLDLCSMSGGHGPEFSFEEGEEGYFFMKKGKNGNYQIPTPSSGFDRIKDGKVYATYRHTYHQALVPIEDYELTYKEIWSKYHSDTFESARIIEYMEENLTKAPAGFEEDEIDLFFKQHVALETAYLLEIELDIETLKKFANSDNFHSQVSALRAFNLLKSEAATTCLLEYIQDEENDNFTKVIAIWSLWKIGDKDIHDQLSELKSELSEEDSGFGGNIMDPRVCTHFPSPKDAIVELEKKK